MHDYLKWDKIELDNFSDANIEQKYDQGYVFTRLGNGHMDQTRSLRIDLDKFELNSENRRILKKTDEIKIRKESLPYSNYHWSIHKLGKEFYDKFQEGLFSANKVKELFTNQEKSDFNVVFVYSIEGKDIGYCINLESDNILHYSFPFYDRNSSPKYMGMGMMVRAIRYANGNEKKYFYLGSAQRPSDKYKLQFEGLEWFDQNKWSQDLYKLKNILKSEK
jgi:arginyl-tRNA--protein-N-Asp/Glu arginylyltransferase